MKILRRGKTKAGKQFNLGIVKNKCLKKLVFTTFT